MSEDFEDRLRSALRPIDPGEQFTRAVMSRISLESTRTPALSRPTRPAFQWLSAGLMVSMVLGVLVSYQWQQRRAQGLEARRQLIEALRLTDQKLNYVYRVVNSGT
jgi:hypothetical protein